MQHLTCFQKRSAFFLLFLVILVLSGCTTYQVTFQPDLKNPPAINWDADFHFSPHFNAYLRKNGISSSEIPETGIYHLGMYIGPGYATDPDSVKETSILSKITLTLIPARQAGAADYSYRFYDPDKRIDFSNRSVRVHERRFFSILPFVVLLPGQKTFDDYSFPLATWQKEIPADFYQAIGRSFILTQSSRGEDVLKRLSLESQYNLLNQAAPIALRLALADLANQLRQEKNKLKKYTTRNDPVAMLKFVRNEPWGAAHGAYLRYVGAHHPQRNDLEWQFALAKEFPLYGKILFPKEVMVYFTGFPDLSPWQVSQRLKKGDDLNKIIHEMKQHQEAVLEKFKYHQGNNSSSYSNGTYAKKSLALGVSDANTSDLFIRTTKSNIDWYRKNIHSLTAEEIKKLAPLRLPQALLDTYREDAGFGERILASAQALTASSAPVPPVNNPVPTSVTPLNHNAGAFISPYRADGSLALWVDLVLTPAQNTGTQIGSTLVQGAGAYAGRKALEHVPGGSLIGSFIGGRAGKKAAETALANAQPDVTQLRPHANQSFNSQYELVQWMNAQRSRADYIKAAQALAKLYPGVSGQL